MGSSPGDTTIRNCVKYHSGPDNQTGTGTVYPLCTFKSKNNKPPHGNQTRFPRDLTKPHRGVNKESYGKID